MRIGQFEAESEENRTVKRDCVFAFDPLLRLKGYGLKTGKSNSLFLKQQELNKTHS